MYIKYLITDNILHLATHICWTNTKYLILPGPLDGKAPKKNKVLLVGPGGTHIYSGESEEVSYEVLLELNSGNWIGINSIYIMGVFYQLEVGGNEEHSRSQIEHC